MLPIVNEGIYMKIYLDGCGRSLDGIVWTDSWWIRLGQAT